MIVLADTPLFLLKKLLAGRSVRRWVYLGQRSEVLERMGRCLGPGSSPVDYARLLNEISDSKRSAFVHWIDEVARSGRLSREWFFSVPSVKNPANSTLFLQVCYFYVLRELRARQKIDLVVVDSTALLHCVTRAFPEFCSAWSNTVFALFDSVKAFFRSLGRYFVYIPQMFGMFLTARIVFKDRAADLLSGQGGVVLIRNYITGDFKGTSDDVIEKRYFPGLYPFLEEQGKLPVFLPVVLQVKDFRSLCQKVLKSRMRIVFVEEFLKLRDYFYLLWAPLKALMCRIESPLFEGADLKTLITQEFSRNTSEHGFLLAVICSRLGIRLKQKGILPESIVNWAEYQAFEKGLLCGLRESFPSIRILAAHPFCIPPNHLCLIPSVQEKLLNIVPDRTLVLGDLARNIVTQYLNGQKVEYSPLFRYRSVYRSSNGDASARDILVLFGFSFLNAVHTLRLLLELSETLQSFNKVFIKLHPLSNFNGEDLRSALGRMLPASFQFIEGNLEDHLKTVAIGICGATGTAVELVVRGIPVIIAAETRALTMNYLAYREDQDLWRICYNKQDFHEALEFFSRSRNQRSLKIKEAAQGYARAYFADPDVDHYKNFLWSITR